MASNQVSPLPSSPASVRYDINSQSIQDKSTSALVQEPLSPPRQQRQQQQQAWKKSSMTSASSTLSRVAFASAFIACVVNAVGFSCAYWIETEVEIPPYGTNHINIGLFRGCSTFGGCAGGSDGVKFWRKAAAGLEIFGLIFTVFTLVSLGLYLVLCGRKEWAKWLRIASAGCTAIAGALIISTVSLFSIHQDNVLNEMPGHKFRLSWAFALCADASAFSIFTLIMLVIDIIF